MAVYYPQGIMTLRVIMEDFNDKSKAIAQELHIFSVVCKTITVNLNSYREADEFSATIDFKNFPFDPRAIRSAGVTIHIEDRKKLFKTNNARNVIEPTADSIVFQGFVDTDTINLSEDSRTVRLEGRDFTSLLIDRPYLGEPIPYSKPIDQILQDLLNQLEQTKQDPTDPRRGVTVVNATGQELPTLAGLGVSLEPKANKKNGRKKRTYWDIIQAAVADAGLIAYISLDQLIINKPRTLYEDSKRKIFIFGENVKEMEFERKLGRKKGFNVRVLSLNVETKEVIEAKIPEEATDEWLQAVGLPKQAITVPQIRTDGSKAPDEEPAPFLTFRLRDIASKEHLVEVGQSIFEEIGRQQIEGRLSTKEMQLCEVEKDGQRPSFINATQLRVGAAIELTIDQGDMKGLPQLLKTTSKENRKTAISRFLKRNCYNSRVADAFADALVNYDTPFYVRAIELTLDQESGFKLDIDFINFIELPKNLTQGGQ